MSKDYYKILGVEEVRTVTLCSICKNEILQGTPFLFFSEETNKNGLVHKSCLHGRILLGTFVANESGTIFTLLLYTNFFFLLLYIVIKVNLLLLFKEVPFLSISFLLLLLVYFLYLFSSYRYLWVSYKMNLLDTQKMFPLRNRVLWTLGYVFLFLYFLVNINSFSLLLGLVLGIMSILSFTTLLILEIRNHFNSYAGK